MLESMDSTIREYDLLIVMDGTGSMGVFLRGLKKAIPEILALSQLSGTFKRLGVMSYHDYCNSQVVNWSGWNHEDLHAFAGSIVPSRGRDYPEAAKSAMIKMLDEVDPSRNTLVLWYADAPPHHPSQPESINIETEIKAFHGRSTDWVHLSYEALAKGCTVFTFVRIRDMDSRYYVLLSQITGGTCLNSRNEPTSSDLISQLTLDVLLTWLGQPPVASLPDNTEARHPSRVQRIMFRVPPPLIQRITDEFGSDGYLPPGNRCSDPTQPITKTPLTTTLDGIPQSKLSTITSLTSLARRFTNPNEACYREAVYSALHSIIKHNVFALSYNPIFGQLWRSICRENTTHKEELTSVFSSEIGRITDPTKREAMKAFMEKSYDASEYIEEIISQAPPNGVSRMYLDLDSLGAVNLTRTELLEVSRSCHSKVMAKLATILTHVKIASPELALGPKQRYIPLSLPSHQIFQLMPHLVVPGTMFSTRPAIIMAILCLIIGVPFLREPAIEASSRFRGKWLDTNVPENISYEFARFILLEGSNPQDVALRLTEGERAVYQGMNWYRLLELNLQSDTTAQVPWKPVKSKEVGDDKIECKMCRIRRSKTVMRNDPQFEGICGICADAEGMNPSDWPDQGDDQSCWVECSVQTCRAQYVIVNAAALRVRPKCWYCRNDKPCPHIECVRCRSRVIVPDHLRTSGTFTCMACTKGVRASIVEVPTQPRSLIEENGVEWLGLKANRNLFKNRSAFKLFEVYSQDFFLRKLLSVDSPPSITLESRFVHNVQALLARIEELVESGTVGEGTCTVCFESMAYQKLFPACGRSGCKQQVDLVCLFAWYGANQPGEYLNLVRTLCPFCRRKPTARTMAKFNPRVATLGGLQEAMSDKAWYYAWCLSCGFAKKSLERVCCEVDRLPNVVNFTCSDCQATPTQESEITQTNRITSCPSCGVMVEKTDGCNHITCICGTHWCHVCGGAFELDDIYNHMSEVHGGFYDDAEEQY